MIAPKTLDNILNSKSKVAIIRLFCSKTNDFKATGREIARLTSFSAPGAHAALKGLSNQGILKLERLGRQHIYSFDDRNRLVQEILRPMFQKETSIKEDIKDFLVARMMAMGLKKIIISILLYGSFARGKASDKSDVDIAVIVKSAKDKKKIEDDFLDDISVKFFEYFKAHLDVYVKSREEFRERLKKNLAPVSTLMKAYVVIYGKEPLEI